MKYAEAAKLLTGYEAEITLIRDKMQRIQASVEPEEVRDYVFDTIAGPTLLSALFGDKEVLFVVHNMGSGCAYCTMWADGFNGMRILDRAAQRRTPG